MQKVKKYLSLAVLLVALPIAAFIATHFVIDPDKKIYQFIPEESDVIIEINTRNFISEIIYQRLFHESYFHEKIVREEGEEPLQDIGFDPFTNVILFREQWSEHNLWMVLAGYRDQEKFSNYLTQEFEGANYKFNDQYVLIQLTPYSDQQKITEHMQNIMDGKVKSFNSRVNLEQTFDHTKEINCYIIPQNTKADNKLLDGHITMDFVQGKILVDGEFTPASGFSENAPIAYQADTTVAFSLRSSLNLLSNLYWFNDDKVQGVPEYNQMAFDYNGVNLFLVHKNLGYTIPFKQYPIMQAHFDFDNTKEWFGFLDDLHESNTFRFDTVSHIMSSPIGTFLNYKLTENTFEMMRNEVNLTANDDPALYFVLSMNIQTLCENTKFAVDENNPPEKVEQEIGILLAEEMMAEIQDMANIAGIYFELRLQDETHVKANGEINMLNADGNSIIESMAFGKSALVFIANYVEDAVSAE